ncbi:DUF4252 domain-containing protein [Flavobacterium sp. HSC-61S13]|uniref:DUF4252 domain-containing protein n=1 Tax=Flavobacterium sp. HSC-61S13 TaxID=2910963 RepID=UPI0020A094AD|nr:DUF4252 domain-containing protein [Flavobacterium sp. HSC-61S13]MCP1995769.1 hypothetical protein [Flavobacterium sp. HSC-61S13]
MKNNYKNILGILGLSLMSYSALAQTEFNKFEDLDNVSTISVNKKMFDMMSNVKIDTSNKENQAYLNLIKKLETLKVYSTKNSALSSEMKTAAENFVTAKTFDNLMTVTDKGAKVKIYVNPGATASNIKQLLMFSDGSGQTETVILMLTGNFSLDEISAITDKMNLPGGSALKKASNQ